MQIWKDSRIENVLLVNHMWREDEEIQRKGLRLYFQEVSESDLRIMKSLELCQSEEENSRLLNQLDKKVLKKLLDYKYLIDSNDELLSSNIWFSQAGRFIYMYFRTRYKLLYPERPSRVLLLPTMKCNGNCVFCITNSKNQDDILEFTADSWKKITHRVVDELKPCNIDIVGGEPFLRSDAVFSIVEELANTNIVLKLITNGERLDYNEIKRLSPYLKRMHHNIQVSLDGTEEVTKRIRPGISYKRVIECVEFLSKEKLNFGINVTVTKLNLNKIEQLVAFVSQYNPIYVTFGPLQVSVKASDYCQKIMIDIEEEEILRDKIKELKAIYQRILFNYDKKEYPYLSGERPAGNKKKLHTCTGFLEEMAIYADGHVVPCLRATSYKEFYGPNILECRNSLQNIWLESDIAKKYRSILLKEPCSSCGYNQQCNQGCPLETYQLDGVFGGYDPHCNYINKTKE